MDKPIRTFDIGGNNADLLELIREKLGKFIYSIDADCEPCIVGGGSDEEMWLTGLVLRLEKRQQIMEDQRILIEHDIKQFLDIVNNR